jgi:hypothetical protein
LSLKNPIRVAGNSWGEKTRSLYKHFAGYRPNFDDTKTCINAITQHRFGAKIRRFSNRFQQQKSKRAQCKNTYSSLETMAFPIRDLILNPVTPFVVPNPKNHKKRASQHIAKLLFSLGFYGRDAEI